jgi:hypothetical protein
MYDNSLSAMYTKCDGKTIAAVDEIGQDGACPASDGKVEPGHIAKYHCLYSTGPNGYLTGADMLRSLNDEYYCFNPNGLKYRYYYNAAEPGHRYIFNLHDGEAYTRYYYRGDLESKNQVKQSNDYSADPAYFVVNPGTVDKALPNSGDPETPNPRYHIRGNGVRTYSPALTDLAKSAYTFAGVAGGASGVAPVKAGEPGEVVFKVEGANVICSMKISASLSLKSADDTAEISISRDNGATWKSVYKSDKAGDVEAQPAPLIGDVNGLYEVLVNVQLKSAGAPADATLKKISFETITQVNSKTQPKLKLGKNTVYLGTGEQTQSIVVYPELQGNKYKETVLSSENIRTDPQHEDWHGVLYPADLAKPGILVYKLAAPGDIVRVTMGARTYNRDTTGSIEYQYSLDSGKTWTKAWELTNPTGDSPWDYIHYEKIAIPKGNKTVLVKYVLNKFSIYSCRAEADYVPADTAFKPMVVTFTWDEPQEDYKTVTRSHTQVVDKPGTSYAINVGGADHPVMKSLAVSLKGDSDVKAGYSDGKDVGGSSAKKFQDRWVTYGKVLSTGKPYTTTEKSHDDWGAGDPQGKILTDGLVGGGYAQGVIYHPNQKPEIVVDMGEKTTCGAFRINTGGYEWLDCIKGLNNDKVEVLVSGDGKEYTSVGNFNFKLRWKDLPVNYMWPDDESFTSCYTFELIPEKPVEARFVKFKVTPVRGFMLITEVQVLDGIQYTPFDLKLALPDGKDRSDISQYNPKYWPTHEYKLQRKVMGPETPAPVGTKVGK